MTDAGDDEWYRVPRISAFYGIIITMYWSDHDPPHYHATYGDRQASVVIATGDLSAGSLPAQALRLVRRWHRLHQDELQRAWDCAVLHQGPGTIEALP
ncbi:MAG: DUF4160 domain-containing protein [Acidimicrobiales bacterium]